MSTAPTDTPDGGSAEERLPELTAPEYASLLDRGPGDLVRAALTDTIARGAVLVVDARVRSGLRTREQTLLVAATGPVDDLPPALAPVLTTVTEAKQTVTVDGTSGATLKHWKEEFTRSVGLLAYRGRVVPDELRRKGLLTRRKTWYRLTVDEPTPLWLAAQASAKQRIAEAEPLLTPEARASWDADPSTAAATLVALGGLGAIALADPALVRTIVELRGLLRGAAASLLPDLSGVDFGSLDLGDFSAIDSVFDGGSDGGFGGGGGDGGGDGGGGSGD